MVVISLDNRNMIMSAIAGLEASPTTLQSQITTLSNLQITLDKMGIPNESERKVRLEAQREAVSRLCLISHPEFKKNFMEFEAIVGKVIAANKALIDDASDDSMLEMQIDTYKKGKYMRKWMDRLGEFSLKRSRIQQVLGDTSVIFNDSNGITKVNLLDFFLDKDNEYESFTESEILDNSNIFKFKTIVIEGGLPLATTNPLFNDSLFLFDFLTDVNEAFKLFGSQSEYDTNKSGLTSLIKTGTASITTTYNALRTQQKASPPSSDDEKLWRTMTTALTEYNNYDINIINGSLGNAVSGCINKISPAMCSYFDGGQSDYIKVSGISGGSQANPPSLTLIAGTQYNQANTMLRFIEPMTINIITNHRMFMNDLYNNQTLTEHLYKLFEDNSVVEYKNPDIKLKSVLEQLKSLKD